MSPRRLVVLSLVAVIICLPTASWAVLVTLTDDAYILTGSPTAHTGTATFLRVVGGTQKAFIKFDLTSLPSGVTASDVAKATLTVWANVVTTPGSIDVIRVMSAWTEAGITASTAPTLGIVDAATVPVTTKNTYITADVTALVQAWIGGSLANNGLALVAHTASTSVQFDSKEASTGQDPRLEITLKGPVGAQGPQGLQGPLGATGTQGPQGPQGAQGPAGTQGPTGVQGPMGPAGTPGVPGTQGPPGPTGPSGPALVVKDANGTAVGSFVMLGLQSPFIIRQLTESMVSLPVNESGFAEGDPQPAFESADCSSTPYILVGLDYMVAPGAVVRGVAYFPSGPASVRTMAASLLRGFTQADCAIFPDQVFFPPDQCCRPGWVSGPHSVAAQASFDLSGIGLVPPFHVSLP